MLNVILLILKIIGITILSIIGLLILLLLLILFVPIRYRVHAEYHKKPELDVGIFWLLHTLSCKIWYKDGESGKSIKLFGVRPAFFKNIFKRNKNDSFEDDFDDFSDDFEDEPAQIKLVTTEAESDGSTDKGYSESEHVEQKLEESGEYTKPQEYTFEDESSEYSEQKTSEESKISGIINKIKKLWNSIKKFRFKLSSICDKIKLVFDKIISYKEFLQMEETKEAITFVKEQAWVLFKLIKPKNVEGYIDFGTGDPAYTGQLLGLMYMFQIYGSERFVITPFFEDTILDGEITLKGRITIFSLLVIGIKVYKNENLKETISRGKNI